MLGSQKRRLSLISDIIIFLFIILVLVATISNSHFNKVEVEQVSALVNNYSTNIQEENKLYLLKIKKDYGITVLYGEDTKDYIRSINATEQINENIINNNLKLIYSSLQKYPEEIFINFQKNNYPLYIMIVDKFEDNNIALASRNNLNQYRIYISNNENFERALHHEMYHILEYYMISKDKSVFKLWDDLNPIGFTYESNLLDINNEYVFDSKESTLNNNPYFVTKYSKANPKEDRAEIFAELMIMKSKANYLEDEQNILKKASCISDAIDKNITSYSFYFHRFIY